MSGVRSGPNGMYARARGSTRRSIDRARCLARLTDRQLVRRYERYLRHEQLADVWVDQEPGLANPRGCRNNLRAWRQAAAAELKRRGLDEPTTWEAWTHIPSAELCWRNRDLEERRAWDLARIQAELRIVGQAEHAQGRPDQVLLQRRAVLEAQAVEIDFACAPDATVAAIPEAMVPLVADRLARHLEARIGWRMRTVEVQHALQAAGVPGDNSDLAF